jgi:fumarylacetoacetase
MTTSHLPYGVCALPGGGPRVVVRVEDSVLDLALLASTGVIDADPTLFAVGSLNDFMAAGRDVWRATRTTVQELLAVERDRVEPALSPLADATQALPLTVADYVDFYSSRQHAENLGRLFRPDAEPLLPNWLHLPIGYHGRAGTVVPSGTPVVRPAGQVKPPDAAAPLFRPSARLDLELELGAVIGLPSELGEPVDVERAREHVFGLVLVNDWSARDIQAWEYQPLGPFLGKSFATSIACWVTPLEALEPWLVEAPPQDPEPLPYLRAGRATVWDLDLEVELRPAGSDDGEVISRTNASNLYWTLDQQIAHLTSNGATLRTGDLLASGTISGEGRDSRGSLIELTWNGAEPLKLTGGATRTFLEDGDEIVLRGRTPGPDGFELGSVSGQILPAVAAT